MLPYSVNVLLQTRTQAGLVMMMFVLDLGLFQDTDGYMELEAGKAAHLAY